MVQVNVDNMEEIGSYVIKISGGDSYIARFYNPITFETENLGGGTYEECCQLYINRQTSFYRQHKYLLPKSIWVDSTNKFRLSFNIKRIYGESGYKTIYVGRYKTLQEALVARTELIMTIIQ